MSCCYIDTLPENRVDLSLDGRDILVLFERMGDTFEVVVCDRSGDELPYYPIIVDVEDMITVQLGNYCLTAIKPEMSDSGKFIFHLESI